MLQVSPAPSYRIIHRESLLGPIVDVPSGRRRGFNRVVSSAVHEHDDLLGWDKAMMARIRVGDDEALSAVYLRYGSLVHGIATQLLGEGDAADVTQEVFLAVWEKPETFDPERGALRTYLAVRTRGRCLDRMRSATRRAQRETRVAKDQGMITGGIDDLAVGRVVAQQVREALAVLPDEQRQAVSLAYLDGLTYQQVAMVMGSPEGTTKSRLRLGLARLARELADWNLVRTGDSQ